MKKIILILSLFTACQKPDCGCGEISQNDHVGERWTITWIDECSGKENKYTFMIDMSNWKVGDRICELELYIPDPCEQ